MSLHGFLYMMDTEDKGFLLFEEDLRSKGIQSIQALKDAVVKGKTCRQLNIPNWAYEEMKDALTRQGILASTGDNPDGNNSDGDIPDGNNPDDHNLDLTI